ncbi:hypothetical protein WJ972_07755 [Achromobacter insuavis]
MSAIDRPAEPWLTPHTSSPRFLMASTVAPAVEALAVDNAICASAAATPAVLSRDQPHAVPVFEVCKKGMNSRLRIAFASDCIVIWL